MGLYHPSLLLGAGEWAGHVLEALESGTRVQGGGGSYELRLRRSAAGVVLKVDELSSKWRRSMVAISLQLDVIFSTEQVEHRGDNLLY